MSSSDMSSSKNLMRIGIVFFMFIICLIAYFLIRYYYKNRDKKIKEILVEEREKKLKPHDTISYKRQIRNQQYKELVELDNPLLRVIKDNNLPSMEREVNMKLLKENRKFLAIFIESCLKEDIYKFADPSKISVSEVALEQWIRHIHYTTIDYTDYIIYPFFQSGFLLYMQKLCDIIKNIAVGITLRDENVSSKLHKLHEQLSVQINEWIKRGDKDMNKKTGTTVNDIFIPYYEKIYDILGKYLDIIDIYESNPEI